MNPFLLLLTAMLTPFLLALVLLGPPYAGILGASYIVYDIGPGINPLADHLTDVFYIIDVYSKLLSAWTAHPTAVSLVHYTLPVITLPLAGILVGLWLTRKFVRKMIDIFHLSVSH